MRDKQDHDIPDKSSENPRTTSRRSALKAGVGIGVGAVAWSGPTITSLGGTPAYALGCTFARSFELESGCRNTAQGCKSPSNLGYQYPNQFFPIVFTDQISVLDLRKPDGTLWSQSFECNEPPPYARALYPAGIECRFTFQTRAPSCGAVTGNYPGQFIAGTGDVVNVPFPDSLDTAGALANTQYRFLLECKTVGSDDSCFT